MTFLFSSAVIRGRASDRGPRPEALRSWRWVFLSAMLLAAATFSALYVGPVQAQAGAGAAAFCSGYSNRIGTSSYGFSVNENAAEITTVGTLAACGNPHRASLTYSVGGADAAAFNEVFDLQANKGEIAVKIGASIDYERGPRSYSLTATVTDADDSSEVTIPLSITVLNVDDPGTIRLSTTDPGVGRQVSFSLSDPDGNPRIYRIEWSRADNRRSPFVRFLPVDDPESDLTQYVYTLRAEDRGKLIKVTAYYVDDECLDITSFRTMCRKGAEATFGNIVADGEGLRGASQLANSPATGRVVPSSGRSNGVESPPRIHNVIQVYTYSLRDADGLPSRGSYHPKTYRWFRVDPLTLAEEEIPNYGGSYVPTKADFGKSLKVQVSFYDNYNNRETLTSPLTAPVQRGHSYAATGSPVITGTVQVGETLSVTTSGISDRNGIDRSALTYQWIANDGTDDTDIQDATGSTYTPAAADEGKTIKVRVSFTDESLYEESRTSAPTATVAPQGTSSQSRQQNSRATSSTGTAPTIEGSPALSDAGSDGQWTPGEAVQVTLTFSEEVNVDTTDGTPSIRIQLGGTLDRSASYTSGSGTTKLVFSHTLTDDDGSHSSMFVPEDSLTLNDGTITSASSGGDAALGHVAAAMASLAVAVVPNSAATGAPTISGTAQVGQTLTASTSDISDSDGLADAIFTYQWIANDGTEDANIQDATGLTYTLAAADEGKTIKVRVSFTDDGGSQETRTSDVTVAVAAIPNSAATGAPTISGTAQVGQTLTASTSAISDSDGLADAIFTYQWIANDGTEDTDIQDATGSTYTLAAADEGKPIKVRVSFTDDRGSQETRTSDVTVAVAAIPNSAATGAPTISGTAQVGQTLTASTSAISDSDGLADAIFTYQWIANDGTEDTDIQDATGSTYTLAAADEGKPIKVRVSFTDDRGSQETRTSDVTVAVAAIPNSAATGAPTISGTAQVGQTLTASTSAISDSDGLADAIFTYQWIANDGAEDTDIQDATASTYILAAADEGKPIKVRVSFTDDGGNQETRTSDVTVAVAAALSPLTAAIDDAPESHDGQDAFKFELRFSEEFSLSYKTLRDHAFTVTSGQVTGARRLDSNSNTPNIRWEITVSPDSNGEVTVELPVTTDCEAQGAICADDGTMLSSPLKFIVEGPPLTASFESGPTSHNGSDEFRIRIALSEEPKSGFSYTTMRDHAFTVTRGSVTGARRLVSGSNIRWEIVVKPDSNGDVTVALPVTTDCDAQGAICAEDKRMLSSPLEFIVTGPGQ